MNVLENVMDINFLGGVRFIRAFLPLARAARGRIIINSALMARTVLPFNAGYAASKCALEGWADSLRREVGPYGVRVVLIEAAGISTGLTRENGDAISDDNPYPVQRPFLQEAFRRLEAQRDDPRCSPRRPRRSSPMHCRHRVHESGTTSVADRAPSTRSERYPMESRTVFLGDSFRLRRRQAVMADGCADEFVSELSVGCDVHPHRGERRLGYKVFPQVRRAHLNSVVLPVSQALDRASEHGDRCCASANRHTPSNRGCNVSSRVVAVHTEGCRVPGDGCGPVGGDSHDSGRRLRRRRWAMRRGPGRPTAENQQRCDPGHPEPQPAREA